MVEAFVVVDHAMPSDRFEVAATLIHDHPMMPKMTLTMSVDRESYLGEVARARTFCFEYEVAYLKSQGLAQGGSLENAIVIGKDKFHTNSEGLRFADEFVRHKALDAIGDLALAGAPILGAYRSIRGGHKLNHAVLTALIEDSSAWTITEGPKERVREHAAAIVSLSTPA